MTGNDLKRWRTKHGWNQHKLSRYLGSSQADVSRWENGKYSVPRHVDILMQLYRDDANIEATKRFLLKTVGLL